MKQLCAVQGEWEDRSARLVLRFCATAQALLDAGATPIPLDPAPRAGTQRPGRQCATAAQQQPVAGIVSVMPHWALNTLRWVQPACG